MIAVLFLAFFFRMTGGNGEGFGGKLEEMGWYFSEAKVPLWFCKSSALRHLILI